MERTIKGMAGKTAKAIPTLVRAYEGAFKALGGATAYAKMEGEKLLRDGGQYDVVKAVKSRDAKRAASIIARVLGHAVKELFEQAGTNAYEHQTSGKVGTRQLSTRKDASPADATTSTAALPHLQDTLSKLVEPLIVRISVHAANQLIYEPPRGWEFVRKNRYLLKLSTREQSHRTAVRQTHTIHGLVLKPALTALLGEVDHLAKDKARKRRILRGILVRHARDQLQGARLHHRLDLIAHIALKYDEQLTQRVSDAHSSYVKPQKVDNKMEDSFADVLAKSTRDLVASTALKTPSPFKIPTGWRNGWGKLWQLALWTPGLVLNIQRNETQYVLERLLHLEESDFTGHQWLDRADAWMALLKLRSRLHADVALHCLEAIAADAEVLKGLGMANALREAVCDENGKPPDYLTYLLKDGPGKHLKEYTYTYRKRLNIEIARINRVQVLQERVVGFWGAVILSAMIALFNAFTGWLFGDGFLDMMGDSGSGSG